ncbi:Endopolyphosphatase [Paecilomyces lecythidis]|uniref:Endopolyphosphatase n=1 Tax=Paecilomyces lecythidis TaxID=3004212 RepID=A0ABR3YB69_9EURO
MVAFLLALSLLTASAACVGARDQIPLQEQLAASRSDALNPPEIQRRPSSGLKGRFLHITDFHPDSHYRSKSRTDEDVSCHRGKGDAGYFGAEGTECDSPFSLINATFKWIDENLKDEIDFVLWTGDSARHDNDERIPRTEDEVASLNQYLVDKFVDVFGKEDNINDTDPTNDLTIPIVPTIGNNDILPHNILRPGPNKWTKKFLTIWRPFIPEEQRHTFVEGGWYWTEVIPNRLAVVSLNTQYFYESNSAVDGCKRKSEPGYEQMDWLRVQLELFRERNVKAILIGHVPPARTKDKQNWDETCWQKYALWLHRFRDVIVGSVYGHMNIDHFIIQDSHDVDIVKEADTGSKTEQEFTTQSRSSYLASLRDEWARMPSPPLDGEFLENWDLEDDNDLDLLLKKKGKKKRKFLKKIGGRWAERYSVSLVAPSVVPNYFPSLRVIEYNVTGLESAMTWAEATASPVTIDQDIEDEVSLHSDVSDNEVDNDARDNKKGKKGRKNKKPNFKVPDPPSARAPPGPAYSNQPLSWLNYTQYFANLTMINEQAKKLKESEQQSRTWREYKLAKSRPDYSKVPFEYEVEYETKTDKVYHMKDLTVRSFFKLATRIANDEPTGKDQISSSTSQGEYMPESQNDITATHGLTQVEDRPVEETKKAKGKKKHRNHHKNRVWVTFFERAFVGLFSYDDMANMQEELY